MDIPRDSEVAKEDEGIEREVDLRGAHPNPYLFILNFDALLILIFHNCIDDSIFGCADMRRLQRMTRAK